MDILKSVNWVDIVVVLTAVRIFYISAQTGFVVEFFKSLASFAALFAAFHYYTVLGGLVPKTFVSEATVAALAFALLWLLVLVLFKFIRDGLLMLFTVKTENAIDTWGAVIISVFRIAITVSMLMFLFLASGQKYLKTTTLTSLSGRHFLLISPVLYRKTCESVVTRLFPEQKMNVAVSQTLRDAVKK